MSKSISFGRWDASVQSHPDQKKRLSSAVGSKLEPVSIDTEHKTGVFAGSGKAPYETTLSECTCIDFMRRKLPCKHMYRLAIELGLIDPNDIERVKYSPPKKDTIKDKAKRSLEGIGKDTAEVFYDYFYKMQHGKNVIVNKSEVPDVTFSSGIFVQLDDDRIKLMTLKKSDLQALCPVKVPAKSKKDVFVDVILDNMTEQARAYCDSLVVIDLGEAYKDMDESLKRHLLKLYPEVKRDPGFGDWL